MISLFFRIVAGGLRSPALRWALAGALAVAAVIIGLVAVWRDGRDAGRLEVRAAWDRSVLEATAKAQKDTAKMRWVVDEVDKRLAVRLDAINRTREGVIREITHEVRTHPVYSECRISDRLFERISSLYPPDSAQPDGSAGPTVPLSPPDGGPDNGGAS